MKNQYERLLPMEDVTKVKFYHTRENSTIEGKYSNLPIRNTTTCTITLKDDVVFTGISRCSVKDQFCKATARQIAYGRACKNWWEWLGGV